MATEEGGPFGGAIVIKELEEGEMEEGEVEEEHVSERATKSPLPAAMQTVAATNCGGPSAVRADAGRLQATRPATAAGPCGGLDARGPPTVPRPAGRAPPTEPRALRVAQSNDFHVPSTPGLEQLTTSRQISSLSPSRSSSDDARTGRPPPTAPRAMRGPARLSIPPREAPPSASRQSAHLASPHSPSLDAQGAREHRAPSPPRNPRPPKRRRADPALMPHVMPSARDMEFSRMEQLVRDQSRRIHDMEWEICEWAAKLHIYKTRGPDSEWDVALREKITRKYWKLKHPEEIKENWRLEEISDLSDDEPPQSRRLETSRAAPDSGIRDGDDGVAVEEIFTMYDNLDGSEAEIGLDDDTVAAASDLVAGAKALKLTETNTPAVRGSATDASSAVKELSRQELLARTASSAVKELSRQELLARTATAQYGLRFSYTLQLCQGNGQWLPAPLGRFGQPFWKGSAWEDFDPRRIYEHTRPDYVERTSTKYLELAEDASRIAFPFRSATQRQVVVLWALQNGVGLVHHNEPDMVSLCRTNPSRVPIAIRRNYRRGVQDTFYAEYDAADIGNHITITMSGPQKFQDGLPRGDYHAQKRAWLQLLTVFTLDWLPLFHKRLGDPDEVSHDVKPWPVDVDLVDRNLTDDVLFEMFWYHLTTNSIPRRSLLPRGEFHDYVRRWSIMQQEVERLAGVYGARLVPGEKKSQEAERRWIADRLPYEAIPSGMPVLRIKLSKAKIDALALKYRERRNEKGNEKGFIPL